MRPLLPQSRFNFPVLLKLVVIYGVITLLCVVVVAFVVSEFGIYRFVFRSDGVRGVITNLSRDFVGMDSYFMQTIRQADLLTILIPLGAGGVLGVIHYIFVRRRKSDIQTIEESLESEVDLK